jgi:hypothetical protein
MQTPNLIEKKVNFFWINCEEQKEELEWQIKALLVKRNESLIRGERSSR